VHINIIIFLRKQESMKTDLKTFLKIGYVHCVVQQKAIL